MASKNYEAISKKLTAALKSHLEKINSLKQKIEMLKKKTSVNKASKKAELEKAELDLMYLSSPYHNYNYAIGDDNFCKNFLDLLDSEEYNQLIIDEKIEINKIPFHNLQNELAPYIKDVITSSSKNISFSNLDETSHIQKSTPDTVSDNSQQLSVDSCFEDYANALREGNEEKTNSARDNLCELYKAHCETNKESGKIIKGKIFRADIEFLHKLQEFEGVYKTLREKKKALKSKSNIEKILANLWTFISSAFSNGPKYTVEQRAITAERMKTRMLNTKSQQMKKGEAEDSVEFKTIKDNMKNLTLSKIKNTAFSEKKEEEKTQPKTH